MIHSTNGRLNTGIDRIRSGGLEYNIRTHPGVDNTLHTVQAQHCEFGGIQYFMFMAFI